MDKKKINKRLRTLLSVIAFHAACIPSVLAQSMKDVDYLRNIEPAAEKDPYAVIAFPAAAVILLLTVYFLFKYMKNQKNKSGPNREKGYDRQDEREIGRSENEGFGIQNPPRPDEKKDRHE